MKKAAYFLFGFSLILFIISLSLFISYRPVEVKKVFASVEVTENTGGFDLNSTALTFGKIAIGGSATRNLLFANGYSVPVIIYLEANGNIADLLVFQKSYSVAVGESISIPFSVITHENTSLGFYSGIVDVGVYLEK